VLHGAVRNLLPIEHLALHLVLGRRRHLVRGEFSILRTRRGVKRLRVHLPHLVVDTTEAALARVHLMVRGIRWKLIHVVGSTLVR
jgi:hypothetical protein